LLALAGQVLKVFFFTFFLFSWQMTCLESCPLSKNDCENLLALQEHLPVNEQMALFLSRIREKL